MKNLIKFIATAALVALLMPTNISFASEYTGSFTQEVHEKPTETHRSSSGGGGGGATRTTTFKKGDANKDGKVNILDFVILMANWNKAESGNRADFNADGKVNILDFVVLMANWTK